MKIIRTQEPLSPYKVSCSRCHTALEGEPKDFFLKTECGTPWRGFPGYYVRFDCPCCKAEREVCNASVWQGCARASKNSPFCFRCSRQDPGCAINAAAKAASDARKAIAREAGLKIQAAWHAKKAADLAELERTAPERYAWLADWNPE